MIALWKDTRKAHRALGVHGGRSSSGCGSRLCAVSHGARAKIPIRTVLIGSATAHRTYGNRTSRPQSKNTNNLAPFPRRRSIYIWMIRAIRDNPLQKSWQSVGPIPNYTYHSPDNEYIQGAIS